MNIRTFLTSFNMPPPIALLEKFFKKQSNNKKQSRTIVIGLGGGGCNIVNYIATQTKSKYMHVGINTDMMALEGCEFLDIKVSLPSYKGLGLGGEPELTEEMVIKAVTEINQLSKDYQFINFVSCLGRGTGTSLISLLYSALITENKWKMIRIFVTQPFSFEGKRRMQASEKLIQEMVNKKVNLSVYQNDTILKKGEPSLFTDALELISQKIFNDMVN